MGFKKWPLWLKLTSIFSTLLIIGMLVAAVTLGIAYSHYQKQLPDIRSLHRPQLNVPLRVFTREGDLIGEFGAERRAPLNFAEIPPKLIEAFLAAEDDRFFEHPGVDWQGILRAVINLVMTGEKTQGGSTITMQLARNLFLTRERSYERKIKEILLALKIESEISKREIIELYLNKIYLGNRAYGVGAAAKIYYSSDITELTLPQMAMIASLPKAPSRYNPIASPERALTRRNYVLDRMLSLGYISRAEYDAAIQAPVSAKLRPTSGKIEADYAAELVRAEMIERYGESAYTRGYNVTTTLSGSKQLAANDALRRNLSDYDKRHGYRGPRKHLRIETDLDRETLNDVLGELPRSGHLYAAVVLESNANGLRSYSRESGFVDLDAQSIKWMGSKASFAQFKRGDLIYLEPTWDDKTPYLIAQIPQVQGALVALDPTDGAILAMAGGFDYRLSKFNRVSQAQRQPGSAFKPFLYAAALDQSFTPASIINDAPVVFEDPALGREWRPENYSHRFYGPTRLREALVHSRNLVSIRLLQAIGIGYALRYFETLGLPRDRLPRDLSLSLGSATLSPLEVAAGYAVFANGGYRVKPHLIQKITTVDGDIMQQTEPLIACDDCNADIQAPRVMSAQTAWLMNSLLQDVIRRGTGRKALSLGRSDLAGKTGTTNDQKDAWFSGFNGELVATHWVGFDQLAPLGKGETGGKAALPGWIRFMGSALKGEPESVMPRPPGLVSVRIDPRTGLLADGYGGGAIFEVVPADRVPPRSGGSYYNQPSDYDYGQGSDHDYGSSDGDDELF